MDDSSGSEVTLERGDGPARTRPRALWGALAALVVFGATLAFAAAGDGDGSPRQLPVGLASGGAAEQATADLSMAVPTRYVAGDGLPDLGGEATAHRLGAEISAGRLESLAQAFGFEAAPVNSADGWTIDDGDQLLVVTRAGGLPWSYAGPEVHVGVEGGGASGGAGVEEQCIERDGALECSFSETGVAIGGECGPADSGVCTVTEESEPTTTVVESGGGDCLPTDGPAECVTGDTKPGEAPSQDAADCPPVDPNACTPPLPDTVPTEVCETSHDGTTRCASGTVSPAPDLPARDEAERIALDLLGATGIDVAEATVTVDGPFEAWYVTVEPVIDGVPASGFGSMVAVGPGGEVLHASGHLADTEAVGEYPLLDTRAAIDRLNAQQVGWSAYSPMAGDAEGPVTTTVETTACPPGAACATDCVELLPAEPVVHCAPDDVRYPCDLAAEDQCAAPTCPDRAVQDQDLDPDAMSCLAPSTTVPFDGPVECPQIAVEDLDPDAAVMHCEAPTTTVPEPVEVVLTSAEPILLLTPAIDGTSDGYLVPGYRLGSDDGHQVDVVALADEALAGAPTTDATEPAPAPPEPVTPPVCEVIGEGDASGTTHTVVTPGCEDQVPPSEPEAEELGERQEPQLGVPYRVQLILHCVHLVDWDGRWWGTEAINPPDGWTGTGTFTLTAPDEGTYVDDGAPHDPATFLPMGFDYPGCD